MSAECLLYAVRFPLPSYGADRTTHNSALPPKKQMRGTLGRRENSAQCLALSEHAARVAVVTVWVLSSVKPWVLPAEEGRRPFMRRRCGVPAVWSSDSGYNAALTFCYCCELWQLLLLSSGFFLCFLNPHPRIYLLIDFREKKGER